MTDTPDEPSLLAPSSEHDTDTTTECPDTRAPGSPLLNFADIATYPAHEQTMFARKEDLKDLLGPIAHISAAFVPGLPPLMQYLWSDPLEGTMRLAELKVATVWEIPARPLSDDPEIRTTLYGTTKPEPLDLPARFRHHLQDLLNRHHELHGRPAQLFLREDRPLTYWRQKRLKGTHYVDAFYMSLHYYITPASWPWVTLVAADGLPEELIPSTTKPTTELQLRSCVKSVQITPYPPTQVLPENVVPMANRTCPPTPAPASSNKPAAPTSKVIKWPKGITWGQLREAITQPYPKELDQPDDLPPPSTTPTTPPADDQ